MISKAPQTIPFWRQRKELNPAHGDYRPPSEDLPLLAGEWIFRTEVYESELSEMRKQERNISRLEKSLNPNVR